MTAQEADDALQERLQAIRTAVYELAPTALSADVECAVTLIDNELLRPPPPLFVDGPSRRSTSVELRNYEKLLRKLKNFHLSDDAGPPC